MTLPDLPPDLTFPPLGPTADDIAFAFQAKRAALGPHVAVRWGWDDAFQRAVHAQRYRTKPVLAIRRPDRRLGTIAFARLPTYLRLGEFYLLPEFQGRGIGTAVLRHCLAQADGLGLPVRLEYLHWNPVGALYRRCGFVDRGRSDIHCFLERTAVPPQARDARDAGVGAGGYDPPDREGGSE